MNRLSYANNVKMIQHSMRFPEPYDDGIYPIPSDDYVCGCASLRMLKSWFRPVWDNLLQCDFEVKVYSVHPRYVRYGGKQVVFNYKKAKRVL